MKFLQAATLLSALLVIGTINVSYDLDPIRLVGKSNDIRTAIVGNSHSNALRYPESLQPYYLNEAGASFPEKLTQTEMAIEMFSDIQLVISDISPAEFYACGERDEYRRKNIFMLEKYDLSQVAFVARRITNLLVVDPRKYLNERSLRPNPQNGKVMVRETVAKNMGAARHLRACTEAESDSMVINNALLERLVAYFAENNLTAIIVIPPHTKRYRDELADTYRGGVAVNSMYDAMSRIEANFENICLIDLYELEIGAENFLDGDHLSRQGEERVAPILEHGVAQCLSEIDFNPIVL